jgi:hypothetical protein
VKIVLLLSPEGKNFPPDGKAYHEPVSLLLRLSRQCIVKASKRNYVFVGDTVDKQRAGSATRIRDSRQVTQIVSMNGILLTGGMIIDINP